MIEQIKSLLDGFDFEQVGFLNLSQPQSHSFYKNWLDEGLNAQMHYLDDHLEKKKDLKELLPQAKSLITFTQNYWEHPEPHPETEGLKSKFKIARYARGYDYHFWFKAKLDKVCQLLKEKFPDHNFLSATDSLPILERDFAYQAGLGWFGKNTCIIHSKKGSFFLIGEIITSLPLESQSRPLKDQSLDLGVQPQQPLPHPDRCGKCTKCIEACPTDALRPLLKSASKSKVYSLDASKCISYWTIESKTTPPIDLAKKFDSWFFGCDICQDVCPWNQKVINKQTLEKERSIQDAKTNSPINDSQDSRQNSLNEILKILKSSNKSLEKRFKGSPMTRPRGFGLKRNALIVALNLKAYELIDELDALDLGPRLNDFKLDILKELEL